MRRVSKFMFIAAVLFSVFFVFFSCSNLFDDINVASPASSETVTITGTFGMSGRMAMPSNSFAATQYTVTATAPTFLGTVEGNANSTNKTFSIALPVGYKWTITIVMEVKESETDTEFKTIFQGSYTFTDELTAAYVTTPVTVVLAPLSGGYGKINLPVSVASGVSAETVVISGLSDSPETYTLSDGTYTINKLGVPSGAYTVTIDFKNTAGLIIYSNTQTINVLSNMTTTRWVSDGSSSPINGDGAFVVTESLVQAFATSQIYVGANPYRMHEPSDTNLGTPYAPLATLGAALSRMTDSTKNYTIHIYGEQRGNFTLGVTSDAPSFAANSVTLCGMTDNTTDILNGDTDDDGTGNGSVLTITTTKPVTIKKLKITKGNATQGGGVKIGSNTNVTLGNGTLITENSASQHGGGIYISGESGNASSKPTLVINDGVKITSNVVTSTSSNTNGGLGIYATYYAEVVMNGGEISDQQHGNNNKARGGGVRLADDSIFTMNGGKVTRNKIYDCGANFFVADRGKLIINAGEISDGEIDNNATDANAGGIWINSNSEVTMNGGLISGNKVTTTKSGKKAQGAGVFIYSGGKLTMTGGLITGNQANGSSVLGVGVLNGGTLIMGGSARIDDSNDVYLSSEKTVTIAGALTGNSPVATILPASYARTEPVLVLSTNPAPNPTTTLAAEHTKFSVIDNDTTDTTIWTVNSDGELCASMTASAAASAIQNMSGADNNVVISGTLSDEDFASLREAMGSAYYTDNTTRINLDLSCVTGITQLPTNAFDGATALKEIILPEGLVAIPDSVMFRYCSNLTDITIPSSLTSFNAGGLTGCIRLENITVPESNSYFKTENNCLLSKDGKKLIMHLDKANTSSFTVPDGVERVEGYAFCDSKITSISFPDTLQYIGYNTFYYGKLTSVYIPDGVELSNYAFYGCTDLTSVRLPDDLESLEYCTFGCCSNLPEITLPASITRIGESYGGAFIDCSNLKIVNYPGTVAQKNNITINDTVLQNADWIYWLPSGTDGTAGTTGTYVLFGEFPQTIKASGVNVDVSETKTAGAFTYYKGSDGAWYAKQAENADEAGYTYSDGTTVAQGGTSEKYFKVEPIMWRVVTEEYNGNLQKMLLAEKALIDCIYYDDTGNRTINESTVYANNYKESQVRAYLNGLEYNEAGSTNSDFSGNGFLQTAFASSSQGKIATTTVYNNGASTDANTNPYTCGNTDDKIFLLSYAEANAYGLNDTYRTRVATDFAKAHGIKVENGSVYWWLRSPVSSATTLNPDKTDGVSEIYYYGSLGWDAVTLSGRGVVPALCVYN